MGFTGLARWRSDAPLFRQEQKPAPLMANSAGNGRGGHGQPPRRSRSWDDGTRSGGALDSTLNVYANGRISATGKQNA
jgi:hypothetical protein